MSERRSGRSRKAVDYTKFSAVDDDDDFSDLTPPPSRIPTSDAKSKKTPKEGKPDKKKKKKKIVEDFENDEDGDFKPKKKKAENRRSLDEKIYERELQLALEISMKENDVSGNVEADDEDVDAAEVDRQPSAGDGDKEHKRSKKADRGSFDKEKKNEDQGDSESTEDDFEDDGDDVNSNGKMEAVRMDDEESSNQSGISTELKAKSLRKTIQVEDSDSRDSGSSFGIRRHKSPKSLRKVAALNRMRDDESAQNSESTNSGSSFDSHRKRSPRKSLLQLREGNADNGGESDSMDSDSSAEIGHKKSPKKAAMGLMRSPIKDDDENGDEGQEENSDNADVIKSPKKARKLVLKDLIKDDNASDSENSRGSERPKRKAVLKESKFECLKKSDSKKRRASPLSDLDAIEVLEEDVQDEEPGGRKKRRRAAAKVGRIYAGSDGEEDLDEDFNLDEEELIADDDFVVEDSDDDYNYGYAARRKSGRGRGRRTAEGRPKPKPRLTATDEKIENPAPVIPVNTGRGKGLSHHQSHHRPYPLPREHSQKMPPANRSPSGKLIIRKPSWIAPGPAGSNKSAGNMRSPGTGLRLGLSKKSRFKPLHGKVKVPS